MSWVLTGRSMRTFPWNFVDEIYEGDDGDDGDGGDYGDDGGESDNGDGDV